MPKTATKRKTFGGIINVCCHQVSFWYDIEGLKLTKDLEDHLTAEADERARHCIADDCQSGELNCLLIDKKENEHEVTGWWNIERD